MLPERVLAVGGLVLSLLLLLRFLRPAVRSWRIYAGARDRRLADAGPLEMAPPATVATVLDMLKASGFVRIGERFIDLPGVGRRYDWVVADDPGSTYVAVVPNAVVGVLAGCYSAFPDGTWLQTNFPRGETIEQPDFVAGFVASSIEDAVAVHRQRLAELERRHGTPRVVRSMADALRMDADYRTRHSGKTLRRLTLVIVAPALASAGLAAICVALLLLGP